MADDGGDGRPPMAPGGLACDEELYPLTKGQEGRVGLLRGAGNMIVVQLAVEFIGAVMDEIGIERRKP